MLAESEIESMNTVERLQAIELLWTSISRSSANVSSPAWHGEVLAARKARVDAGEGNFLTIDELRSRLHGDAGGSR